MSVRRRKKAKALEARPAIKRDDGTPETRAKLRPNPLADFPKELQEAAQHLWDTWVVVTSPARGAMGATFERVSGGHGGLKRGDSNPWWWRHLVIYRLWAEEMARRKLPSRPIVRVVTDDKLFSEVLIPQLGICHPDQVKALVYRGLQIFLDIWENRGIME